MGLFDKLFSGSNEPKQEDATPWIDLNTLEQLEMIKERSKTKTQFVFKHSTRCGISRMVISQFKRDYQLSETEADLYYLDLLNYREISSAIAETFKVMHESPQLLIIKNGVVVANKSHGGINELDLQKFV
ncbi:bacillithiol system protein YtxJ [Gelidibacter algens]|uniref:Bacillithiol system protein YtxJ n=1 Tax=Gelidibacter algens TaxID=49280 RepID=A0A1A7R372_9FLAO|nr:bacillithiol system redox-active protein YtxJ [Gelidibacter algens]OBX26286.1 cytosolic protein [Gelidibacter algens]RAJ24829.1 bacillithiol system protein YtxJ [Gelidibacter algens]